MLGQAFCYVKCKVPRSRGWGLTPTIARWKPFFRSLDHYIAYEPTAESRRLSLFIAGFTVSTSRLLYRSDAKNVNNLESRRLSATVEEFLSKVGLKFGIFKG